MQSNPKRVYIYITTHCLLDLSSLDWHLQRVRIDDVIACFPLTTLGRVRGLYGNFDGDAANDFVSSNGTLFASTSTDKELFEFGESWRVSIVGDGGDDDINGGPTLFTRSAPDHVGWTPLFASGKSIQTLC